MRVHHLNCGTVSPFRGALFDVGAQGRQADWPAIASLIDTGDDLRNVANPRITCTMQVLVNTSCARKKPPNARSRPWVIPPETFAIVPTHLDIDDVDELEQLSAPRCR